MTNECAKKLNPVDYFLLQFEACCYDRYLHLVIELSTQNKPGLNAFVATSAQLDFSVFLYEALIFFDNFVPKKVQEIGTPQFNKNLKIVRNNIHTYYKSGGYNKKANNIISGKQKEYMIETRDNLYSFRNDISLVFQLVEKERRLIGCDYFISHCIFESDEKNWGEIEYTEYSQNLSAIIHGIASSFNDSVFHLVDLKLSNDIPPVELFDWKSVELFTKSGISDAIAFRLMLILSQISYGLLLLDHIIDKNIFLQSELWTLFITKLVAIKYDEAFDNVQSILTHADLNDRNILQGIFKKSSIQLDNLQARTFAQKLRNTIHYNNVSIDGSLCLDETPPSLIKAIYLTNSGTIDMNKFKEKKTIMIEEMSRLQDAIQACFSLNKTFNY